MTAIALAAMLLSQTSQVKVCDPSVVPARCASVSGVGLKVDTGGATQATQDADAGSTLAQIAAQQTSGAQTVRVTNMPPAPTRNPVTGAALVDGSRVVQPVLLDGASFAQLLALVAAQAATTAVLTSGAAVVQVSTQPHPLNPFLPRCNPVRLTQCQP